VPFGNRTVFGRRDCSTGGLWITADRLAAVSLFAPKRLAVIGSEAVDLVRVDDRSIRRGR